MVFKTFPMNITGLKNKHPKAYEYLLKKEPTGITISGFFVILHFNRTGSQLIYDCNDIEFFEENLKDNQ